MARLTIEDSLFSDHRFQKLMICLGCQFKALGVTLSAWRLAQKHWCPGEKLIPPEQWESSGIPDEFLSCGLAVITPEGIYVRGIKEHFAWYLEGVKRMSAGASEGGKRSAAARKEKYGTAQPGRLKPRTRGFESLRGLSNPSNPSSSSSYSVPPSAPSKTARQSGTSSLVLKTEDTKELRSFAEPKLTVPPPLKPGQQIVKTYVDAFRERYRTSPAIDGACLGEVKRLLAGVGVARACLLVQAYLQLEDPKYLAKCHDLTSLRMDLQRVSVALDQGRRDPNKKTWQEIAAEQEET